MIYYKLRQNKLKSNEKCYLKWYAKPVKGESIDLDALAEHMDSHNTPYSLGTIKGVLSDMVVCMKELLLSGNSITIADLATFSVGIRNKTGCENKSEYRVNEYVEGIYLMCRANGEVSFSQLNLDATLKRSPLDKDTDTTTDSTGTSSDGEEDLIGQVEDDLKIVEG
jgi:predicted histone-like DNA-binding protein